MLQQLNFHSSPWKNWVFLKWLCVRDASVWTAHRASRDVASRTHNPQLPSLMSPQTNTSAYKCGSSLILPAPSPLRPWLPQGICCRPCSPKSEVWGLLWQMRLMGVLTPRWTLPLQEMSPCWHLLLCPLYHLISFFSSSTQSHCFGRSPT